jgi:CRP-like cAMP-binding protein
MKEILIYLSQTYWKLDKQAITYILENCNERSVAKGEVLLKEGEVCRYVWFVKKGLLRAYQAKPSSPDKLFSNWFMIENDVATSVISFFLGCKSEETIVAEEDSVVFEMSKKDLFDGIEQRPCMAILTLLIVIKYYCQSRLNETFLRMKEPQLIYLQMLAECPELLQRPKQKDLASYVGVSGPVYRKIKSGKYKPRKEKATPARKASQKKANQ